MPGTVLSKRERVERTLNLLPVDRIAVHDQVSWNPGVVALYTGKKTDDFNYSIEDIGMVIRKTLDMCFRPCPPRGTDRITDEYGFVWQHDKWTTWRVARPFNDTKGLKDFFKKLQKTRSAGFNPAKEKEKYRREFLEIQGLIGDTVLLDYGISLDFCVCWNMGGIDLFSYLYADEPGFISDCLETLAEAAIRRTHAIADRTLSPVYLIADDLASKIGPIFGPDFLRKEFFPRLARLVEAWHSHDMKVLYHSDGNWKMLIPDFLKCGVDGFYCLEPALGMDIIELKKKYPKIIWAGGLDGVDLMERGTPEEVRAAVRKQIEKTDALNTGGLFLATSSEVTPMIKPENFKAMIEEAVSVCNKL